MYEIRVSTTIKASQDDVFALVSDHERFLKAPGVVCRLSTLGREIRNGVGAVREVTAPGSVFTEEVIEFEPPRRYSYVIRSVVGPAAALAPVHDRGWIELSADGDRTRVDWHSRFATPKATGWVLDRVAGAAMRGIFKGFLASAKAALENR
jgi:Polyketide cyclase / dehydrase and lipid transport